MKAEVIADADAQVLSRIFPNGGIKGESHGLKENKQARNKEGGREEKGMLSTM